MYDFRDLKVGDVLAEKLPFGLYTCLVVIKTIDNSKLYYVADYIDTSKPNLNDPRLRKLHHTKFAFSGIAMYWAEEYHDASIDFEYLGNIEIDFDVPKCNSSFVMNAREPFWSWLEINIPDKFEEERDNFFEVDSNETKGKKVTKNTTNKSKEFKLLDDKLFWKMVEHLFPEELDDEYAIKKLIKYSREEIISFHNTLAKHLEVLDKLPLKNNKYNSDDAFLYTRCFIIAQGLEYYNEVLEDGYIEEDLVEDSFEELLEITEEALQRANYNYDYKELLELK